MFLAPAEAGTRSEETIARQPNSLLTDDLLLCFVAPQPPILSRCMPTTDSARAGVYKSREPRCAFQPAVAQMGREL